jgi:hypothetical protein
MYFLVFATDYDGTLAEEGVVSEATLKALRRLKDTGRKLLMVTGREMPDLARVFPHLDLFDKIVAETLRRTAFGGPLDCRHLGASRNDGARSDQGARPRA